LGGYTFCVHTHTTSRSCECCSYHSDPHEFLDLDNNAQVDASSVCDQGSGSQDGVYMVRSQPERMLRVHNKDM
jgi:hypothetical protein